VARIKLAYIGGGSTRAPGTMACLLRQGESFRGSEVALIDLDAERLDIVKTLAEKMACAKGLELTVTATTDRRGGLEGCDAVLTSFRPGGFEARCVGLGDERCLRRLRGSFERRPAARLLALHRFEIVDDDGHKLDGPGQEAARLDRILVGYTRDGQPVQAKEIGVTGSMAAILREAILPNLVQSREGTPAFVHGGPFANIAHGCNSVLATRMALATGDYAVTEAGFAFDLGAEKFFDIRCRVGGLTPSASAGAPNLLTQPVPLVSASPLSPVPGVQDGAAFSFTGALQRSDFYDYPATNPLPAGNVTAQVSQNVNVSSVANPFGSGSAFDYHSAETDAYALQTLLFTTDSFYQLNQASSPARLLLLGSDSIDDQKNSVTIQYDNPQIVDEIPAAANQS